LQPAAERTRQLSGGICDSTLLTPAVARAMADSPVLVVGPHVGGMSELVETGFCVYDLQRLHNEHADGELAVMEVDFYRADALAAIESDEALGALALRAAAAAMQLREERDASARLSSEAAAANSTVDELRSQVQELCSLDIQTQSELRRTRAELHHAADRLREATQSSATLRQELSEKVVALEAQVLVAQQETATARTACSSTTRMGSVAGRASLTVGSPSALATNPRHSSMPSGTTRQSSGRLVPRFQKKAGELALPRG
jgi:hypothetical protein